MDVINNRIAVFTMADGTQVVCGEYVEKWDEYSRVTEYVDVSFPKLPVGDVISGQLEALARVEAKARTEFQKTLDRINDERGKLLSLTNTATV